MKKAFTLAEIMIVLVVIGVLTGIILPAAFHNTPDKNIMKFKKANNTLAKIVREMASSGRYYKEGDLRYKPDGTTVVPDNYMCQVIADLTSTKNVNCSDNSKRNYLYIQPILSSASTQTICNANSICNLNNAKDKLDDICDDIASPKGVTTSDDVIWYEAGRGNYCITASSNPECNKADCNYQYKVLCLKIDNLYFGYGIRSDGRIITGLNADRYLNKSIKDDDEEQTRQTGTDSATAECVVTCEAGYYKNGNSCYKCNSAITGCSECSSSSECIACDASTGYYKSGNTCATCPSGYHINSSGTGCEEDWSCSGDKFMQIGNLCVTKYNPGDGGISIPSSAGVTIATAGNSSSTCGSSSDYTTKCCWQGTTSTSCDANNGGYSGCTRTVCNWNAANAICSNLTLGGKTWRLPTNSEMQNWGTVYGYSRGKGSNGLMLCDTDSYHLSALCDSSYNCYGAFDDDCVPYQVWSSETIGSKSAYFFSQDGGNWWLHIESPSFAFSFRCVTEL